MADQKRNPQSNQKESRGQQGQQGTQNEPRQTQSNQGGRQSQQGRSRDDESVGGSRERSSREPSSTAHDRGAGNERRNMGGTERERLEREGVESDLETETDVDSEDIEGGSGGRSNR